jgi:uncharacterized protein YktA (UPF0223 family)
MQEYQYPLDLDWSTSEMVKVVAMWDALEKSYEQGLENDLFLEKYHDFKEVVRSIGEEKRLGKEFEQVSGYSLYRAVQAAKKNNGKRLKMGA